MIPANPVSTGRRTLVCTLLLLMCAALPACKKRGPAGPAGPAASADTRKPEAPTHLRLELHPAGAPHYLLRWSQPAGSVPVQAHVVYAARQPLQALDPTQAVAALVGNGDFAEVTLLGDTGARFLRVTAVSPAGVESLPSAEYAVDTTGRVLFLATPVSDGASANVLMSQVPAALATRANLTSGNASVTAFRTSPDGRFVAVLADLDTAGTPELFAVPIDGSAPPRKVSGTLAGSVRPGFAFSPAGDRLAFAADAASAGVIEAFVAPIDGSSEPLKISGAMVQGGGIDTDTTAVKWSPDGRRVAYLARQRDAQVQEAFVAPADGSTPPVAVSGDLLAGSSVASFDWSPDGRWIAFRADRGNSEVELFVAPPDGSAPPAVRSGAPSQGADVTAAQWSPDSTRLAFLSPRAAGQQVYVTPADAAEEPIPLDPGFPLTGVTSSFAWSPDASHIAFVASRDSESASQLFTAPATGGAIAAVVSGVLVGGGSVSAFAWSPDGEQLAFLADKVVNNRVELFTTVPGFGAEPFRVSGVQGVVINVANFDWSTEGDRLAFRASTTNEANEVFVVDRYGNRAPEPLPDTGVFGGSDAVAFPHLGQH